MTSFLFASVVLNGKRRKESALAKSRWAGFFQGIEKNELFSSKHAYSWPFVSFDLGIRRLHECPHCCVMCTQCVNYWKWRGSGFIWGRLQCWHAGDLGWNRKSQDAIYLSTRSHDSRHCYGLNKMLHVRKEKLHFLHHARWYRALIGWWVSHYVAKHTLGQSLHIVGFPFLYRHIFPKFVLESQVRVDLF